MNKKDINYTPEQNTYPVIPTFKGWVLQNFPFIEQDFDSLTNYGMMCKLTDYLNKVINNQNLVESDMSKLYEAYDKLQTYVNTYFDSLDVQNEINNKLDKMATNGELTNLIKKYLDPFINIQNNKIESIDNKVNSATSGSPAGVYESVEALTSADPDHSKIYVVSNTGNWYYYNKSSSSWASGGTYQASEILNGSVDILKLDNKLKNSFSTILSNSLKNLESTNSGWCSEENNTLKINTNDAFRYQIFKLKNDTIYNLYGWNMYSVGNIIIVDTSNNNKVLFNSFESYSDSPVFFNATYKTPATGNIKAYCTFNKDYYTSSIPTYYTQLFLITEVSDVKLNKNYYNELNLIATINNYFIQVSNSNKIEPIVVTTQSNVYYYEIYSLKKNSKYKFHYVNFSGLVGLAISDLSYNKIYASSNTLIDDYQVGDYIYEASDDCYAFISYTNNPDYQPSIELITNDEPQEKIGFNKWYAIGDSITEVNFRALHNYLYWINQDLPTIDIINLGVSGTGYKKTDNTFITRLNQISNYNLDNSIITVMGSINDMSFIPDNLGQLGDTTTDTLYGSMYVFFNTLFNKFNGVRVGCITPINWKDSNTSEALTQYVKALKDTCELFNVPFLDLTNNTNLRPNNTNFLNTYYKADGTGATGQIDNSGVHPNSLGHKLLYGRIKEFIKKL